MDVDVDDLIDGLQGPGQQPKIKDEVTKDTALARLHSAWIAERTAPELLDFAIEPMDVVMTRIRRQIEFIEDHSMDMGTASPETRVQLLLIESELERVRFVVRSYLRTRLAKIDRYAYQLQRDDQLYRLSESETKYLERHLGLLKQLYEAQFLSQMPQSLAGMADETENPSMIESPDMDAAVFIRVIRSPSQPVSVGKDSLDLLEGSIYVLRYSAVRHLISDGTVELV